MVISASTRRSGQKYRLIQEIHWSLVTGLIISILQAATQINEMTLSFIPKIIAVFIAIIVAGPWMLNLLLDYVRTLFNNLPYIIG